MAWGILIIAGLRPNARDLSSRSLLLRKGVVDRQRLRAMAAVLGLAIAGDLLHLLASNTDLRILWLAGTGLIAVGSMLLTVGLAGAVADALRIAGVIIEPPPGPREAISAPAGRGPGSAP